jgi:NarL family two-component system response regulator LiaR
MGIEDRIHVLVVDDHALVRKGIRFFLQTLPDIEVVGEAEDGERALTLAQELAPDVILLDLLMPGMGGIEAARRIKEVSPVTRIVALTSSQEREHILPVLRAGASAYVLKDVGPEELGRVIRRVASGEVVIEPRVASQMVEAIRSAPAPGPETQLTPRELEVLRCVAEGKSNAAIAEELFLSPKTVKTHVSNLLAKLQLADRTQAAAFAWKEGLVGAKGPGDRGV